MVSIAAVATAEGSRKQKPWEGEITNSLVKISSPKMRSGMTPEKVTRG